MEVSERRKRVRGRRRQVFVFPQNTQSRKVLVKSVSVPAVLTNSTCRLTRLPPDDSQKTQTAQNSSHDWSENSLFCGG